MYVILGARMTPRESTPDDQPIFPMRINKYLALKGFSTRKGADELISKRKVFINDQLAVLGDKVNEADVVEVRGGGSTKQLVYFAFNKPRSVITHSPSDDEDDIRQLLPELTRKYAIFPVGRLDKDSHGLIILTNDGRITDRLLNPSKSHDKEYVVHTRDSLRESFQKNMESGVDIEGYVTKPAKVRVTGERSFIITISEGKKHQIRRMVAALLNHVEDLQRVRILNITLGNLKTGSYRPIEGDERATFLKTLGL